MTNEELLQIIETTVKAGFIQLNLNSKKLTVLPAEIRQLSKLEELDLSDNQLIELPAEIGQLTNLRLLHLKDNQLKVLPPEIGQLSNLRGLDLKRNKITVLPTEIGQLIHLRQLTFQNNQLSNLPPEINQLSNLTALSLHNNQLSSLPPEIRQLSNLIRLYLHDNQLSSLPPEISQLSNLTELSLHDNQLSSLPPEISQLSSLTKLSLHNNQLSSLPPEISRLSNLRELYLDNNPQLSSPPPEIVELGTQAILTYLRKRLEGSQRQWVSKLLVVGEGGVGKTSLLRALRGEEFDTQESTTHGIEIKSLELNHPTQAVTMQLNTWDFGGQDIYHATHQFFLTNRSLFLLAWNARLGFEQGKLYYWLDTIKALAPESPILLVATHIDERDADLPLRELRDKYPQIVKHCKISSKTSRGIEEIRQAIAEVAAKLPLMGEIWPTSWLNAANAIRNEAKKYITPQQLWDIMAKSQVVDSQEVLARWLHELGEILYFQDNEELNDTVILKPQWVTEYISKVLESEDVINRKGIFTRQEMNQLWRDLEPFMRDHFLRLMERFDLSYRISESPALSLVVERLPLDTPDYQQEWQQIKQTGECNEISMKFQLNTIPAGIPTWFIARQHRFTTSKHWRNGVLFADYEQKHLALVQAFPRDRYLQLTVRGAYPQNFFALLKDGIEVTLRRFPGLWDTMQLKIPCLGHNGKPCSHEFDYKQVQQRSQRKKLTIECPKATEDEDVSVIELLQGLDWTIKDAVLDSLKDLKKSNDEIKDKLDETKNKVDSLLELTQREFTKAFRRQQATIDSHCPNVFELRLRSGKAWQKNLTGQKLDLQLYCQAPGCWHPTQEGGLYEINEPAKWLKVTAPYISKLFRVLRYTAPIVGPFISLLNEEDYEKFFKNDLEFTKELAAKLPELKESEDLELADKIARGEDLDPERADGAALRALRQLLDEKDPQQHWGGLKNVLTPEGHYLWLCEHHAAEYKR
ncbi:COR domain-containing protein [Nostoc sp.]|uniref:COR domain-containing protein n=1 Tax=Nostoc sp. TaxID=1180 RepID=UPI002FF8B9A7